MSFSQTCRTLLQSHDYSTYELATTEIRPASEITNNSLGKELMNHLSEIGDIVANQYSPYTRTQCFGTCYLYSGIGLIENELIQSGLINAGDLLMAPALVIETAQARLLDDESANSLEKLLHGGWIEIFHSTHGQDLFVLPKDEIKKLGPLSSSSEDVLFLENTFLTTNFRKVGPDFRFYDVSLEDPNMSLWFTNNFLSYLEAYSPARDINLKAQTVGPISINYTMNFLYDDTDEDSNTTRYYRFSRTMDTSKYPEISDAESEFLNIDLDSDGSIAEMDRMEFDDEDMKTIVEKLLSNKFLMIGFDKSLFGEGHAVLLTNIVVDHDSKSIVGFIFLDSNSEHSGLQGYNYINIEELKKYMSHYTYVNSIEAI